MPPSVSINQEDPQPEPVKAWTVDDPPRHSFLQQNSDPWPLLLEKQKNYDKERCEGWKDEIDKILIFAALFSAIVASFALDSSRWLQVDHQESTATILYAIHQQLDSMARQNITTLPPIIPNPASTFHPAPHAVQVNVLWYISLTLSLTTTAIGILCLQWLREHQRNPVTDASKLFPFRAMRIEGLDQWKVPAIVGSLPVLLLISLLLYFAGLVLALWSSDKTVAISTSAVICASIAIAILTTVLPGLIPSCVFRSPQFWPVYYPCRAFFSLLGLWIASMIVVPFVPAELFIPGFSRSRLSDKTAKVLGFLWDWSTKPLRKDWVAEDEKSAAEKFHIGLKSFPTVFAQDSDALLSLLSSVEQKLLSAGACDVYRLMPEIYSFFKRAPVPSSPWPEGDNPAGWMSALVVDFGQALCLETIIHLSRTIQPILLPRYFELHLRVFNSYHWGLKTSPKSQLLKELYTTFVGWLFINCNEAKLGLPEDEFYPQFCEYIYNSIIAQLEIDQTWQEAQDDLCLFPYLIRIMAHDDPDTPLHNSIDNLNQRLGDAISTVPKAKTKDLLRHLLFYIKSWQQAAMFGNDAQRQRWYSSDGPGASLIELMRRVWEEVGRYPGFVDELTKEGEGIGMDTLRDSFERRWPSAV